MMKAHDGILTAELEAMASKALNEVFELAMDLETRGISANCVLMALLGVGIRMAKAINDRPGAREFLFDHLRELWDASHDEMMKGGA
jgi:hypothetical protein